MKMNDIDVLRRIDGLLAVLDENLYLDVFAQPSLPTQCRTATGR